MPQCGTGIGIWHLAFGIWYLVFGIWYWVLGIGHWALGIGELAGDCRRDACGTELAGETPAPQDVQLDGSCRRQVDGYVGRLRGGGWAEPLI